MNGNVREWIQDTAFNQGFRGQMGGDLFSGSNLNPNLVFGLDPGFVSYSVPTVESIDVGIRFASPKSAGVEPPTACDALVPGDVTGDGALTIVDVQCIIVSVFSALGAPGGPSPSCFGEEPAFADLDCSGMPTVADVNLSIQLLLGISIDPELDADNDGCIDACLEPTVK
jgi:hypothetical protein